MPGITRSLNGIRRRLVEEAHDFALSRFRPCAPDLDGTSGRLLAELSVNGYTSLEGYWSREKVDRFKQTLEEVTADQQNQDLASGAYIRHKTEGDYDIGVSRIFHVDREYPELKEFRFDPLVLDLAKAYYRIPFFSGLLIFQHNRGTTDNTRYYHVDSWDKEFKAFLYLDDVTEENGPFTYLQGSHRSHLLRYKKQLIGNKQGPDTSFYEEDLGSLLSREVKLCGPAGTMLLADTRGLHRGSPQHGKPRSVLVNYIYRNDTEIFPAK